MADTLTFILDFLEKQKLSKAADALREEIKLKEKAFPGSLACRQQQTTLTSACASGSPRMPPG